AITSPSNVESIAFHTAMGMRMLGEPNDDGVKVIRSYAGPGNDRAVFRMEIAAEDEGSCSGARNTALPVTRAARITDLDALLPLARDLATSFRVKEESLRDS